jgi:hypothetical protein
MSTDTSPPNNDSLSILQSIEKKLDILVANKSQVDSNASGSNALYNQIAYNGQLLAEETIEELQSAYIKMEEAHISDDIFTFGLYVYKQSESIVNHVISTVSENELHNDLREMIGYDGLRLLHKVFSGYTNQNLDPNKNRDKMIIDDFLANGYLPPANEMTYQQRLRYFTWFFDNKKNFKKNGQSRKNDPFFFTDNPYYYLAAARNKIHGGQKKQPSLSETQKITEITSEKHKFFILFYSLLHGFHKRLFNYRNL